MGLEASSAAMSSKCCRRLLVGSLAARSMASLFMR